MAQRLTESNLGGQAASSLKKGCICNPTSLAAMSGVRPSQTAERELVRAGAGATTRSRSALALVLTAQGPLAHPPQYWPRVLGFEERFKSGRQNRYTTTASRLIRIRWG